MTSAYIDIEHENDLITESLKQVSGYLDCERITIRHIHKQVDNGLSDTSVVNYLKTTILHLENAIDAIEDANVQMNYRYVIGFINTLLRTPAWKSWMQSIQQ